MLNSEYFRDRVLELYRDGCSPAEIKQEPGLKKLMDKFPELVSEQEIDFICDCWNRSWNRSN